MRTIEAYADLRGANHPDIYDHHRKMEIIERGG
jgi:hypothetical protein